MHIRKQTVEVEIPNKEGNLFEERPDVADVKAKWLETLADLNVCSQKGLVEMFDGSIGAGSVFMPYGGKYQLTETQTYGSKSSGTERKNRYSYYDELWI